MKNKLSEDQIALYKKAFSQEQTDRGIWESHWQQIAEVTAPFNASFNTEDSPGTSKMDHIFDSTSIHANQLLAAGLFSLMTNPAQEWHAYKMAEKDLNSIRQVAIWTEKATTIAFHEINKVEAAFNTAVHECYIEYGAFGNLVMYIGESKDRDHLVFQSIPLSQCYFREDYAGVVDTLYRKYDRTVRQLVQKFGKDNVHEGVLKLYTEQKYEEIIQGVHIIEPMVQSATKSPFTYTSVYLDLKHNFCMKNHGYYEKPFVAARFYKSTHEKYGRGPGSTSLPDVKMLQELMKVTIRAAQKAIDPPLMVPDQGFLNPVRTYPGGLNYFRAGTAEKIGPLDTNAQPKLGYEIIEEIRNRIQEIFFIDQLQLHEGPQMTATEVIQRTEQQLRLMGPMSGRLQSEFLGPMLTRVFSILWRNGKFPDPPALISDKPYEIIYTSPIARAQEQTKANGIMRTTQLIQPFASVKPDIMDNFDFDKMTVGVANMFSVSPEYLNEEDKIKGIRKARADKARARATAENLRDVGQGASGLATASNNVDLEKIKEMGNA